MRCFGRFHLLFEETMKSITKARHDEVEKATKTRELSCQKGLLFQHLFQCWCSQCHSVISKGFLNLLSKKTCHDRFRRVSGANHAKPKKHAGRTIFWWILMFSNFVVVVVAVVKICQNRCCRSFYLFKSKYPYLSIPIYFYLYLYISVSISKSIYLQRGNPPSKPHGRIGPPPSLSFLPERAGRMSFFLTYFSIRDLGRGFVAMMMMKNGKMNETKNGIMKNEYDK